MNLSKMEGFRMNRRSSGSLFLSKAIGGFIQYKAAEGLSPTTLRSYEDHLKLWVEHLGDKPVNWIKTSDIQEYFVWLRTDYEPRRITEKYMMIDFSIEIYGQMKSMYRNLNG
jgi:hypothetical protein